MGGGRPDAQMRAGPRRELCLEDAIDFLHLVRREFSSEPRVYQDFVEVLNAFRARQISTDDVCARVADLFGGRNDLVAAFNQFVPTCCALPV